MLIHRTRMAVVWIAGSSPAMTMTVVSLQPSGFAEAMRHVLSIHALESEQKDF
jgi:hypothetical protein